MRISLGSLPLLFGCALACSSEVSKDARWGCVQQVSDGAPSCVCAKPAPSGKALDPALCGRDVDPAYVCCLLQGGQCKCGGSELCTDISIRTCEKAYACPKDPIPVGSSVSCDVEGAICPAQSFDPTCWAYSCICSEGTFKCLPGTCA